MTVNCRCTTKSCRQRRTLARHPSTYIKEPQCRACGGRLVHDPAVRAQTRARGTCHCDGYPFPHRPGTEPWCSRAPVGPTDDDYEDRYRGCRL